MRADPALRTLNILALFGYVLIPWASKTLGEAPNGAGVLVYSAAMAFLGGATLAVLRHVIRAGLVNEDRRLRHGSARVGMEVPSLDILLGLPGTSWASTCFK